MMYFRYSAPVLVRYPQVVGGVALARGVRNGPTPAPLLAAYLAEQQATLARVGETPLSEIASLAAWRRAFRGFGVDPTQYRSAPEALLRRLTKKGDIPSVNALVDLGNLVSIRYALPIALFDVNAIQGGVTVRFAEGSESFTTLGESEVEHPEAGEVIFCDEAEMAVARRWCWRQSETSAVDVETTDALITIEAQQVGGGTDVEATLRDLQTLLATYAGGEFTWALLGAAQPEFSSAS